MTKRGDDDHVDHSERGDVSGDHFEDHHDERSRQGVDTAEEEKEQKGARHGQGHQTIFHVAEENVIRDQVENAKRHGQKD